MALTLEQAQAAVAAAEKAAEEAKGKGVSAAVAASKALSAARSNLEAVQAGVDPTGKSRQQVISEMTKARVAEERKAAAEADPMKNPTIRPEAPPSDGKNIFYYGWVGDTWKLYKQPIATGTEGQIATAESRSQGGATQATFQSSVGANTLKGTANTAGTPIVTTANTVVVPITQGATVSPNVSYSGATDSKGKKIYYQIGSFYGGTNDVKFIYEDGTAVPFDEYVNNYQANQFAEAGWNIGFGKGVAPAQEKYKDVIGSDPYAPSTIPGGEAYYDSARNIIVIRDSNGTSLYDSSGKLIFGRGSVNSIGFALAGGRQIDVKGSGNYGSPNYNMAAGSAGGTKTVTTTPGGVVTGSVVTGTPVVTGSVTAGSTTGMTSAQQDIYSIMLGRLNQYNLGALAPLIRKLAIEGATESTIMLQLSEEPLYKERFKANETRKQKGLSVLTPSQYLSLEDDYRQVLRAYGLTQFDNDDYVSQFLANDVSVSELSNRVVTAVQRVRNADPAVSNMLKNLYGIGQNDLVAYVLDPAQQFQKIERQVAASEISVAAARQGFNIGATVAEQLAAQGISQAEAQKGYSTIADVLPTAEKLSDIYGGQLDSYRLPEAEQEVFNQLASAQRKRRALSERELASFSGQAGLGRTSLTQQTGGQF